MVHFSCSQILLVIFVAFAWAQPPQPAPSPSPPSQCSCSRNKFFFEKLECLLQQDQIDAMRQRQTAEINWTDNHLEQAVQIYIRGGASNYRFLLRNKFSLPTISHLMHFVRSGFIREAFSYISRIAVTPEDRLCVVSIDSMPYNKKSFLVVMLHGLVSKWALPIYFNHGSEADFLTLKFWKAIIDEASGSNLIVVATIFDMLTHNMEFLSVVRSAYSHMQTGVEYSNRKNFFFIDPPHILARILMKLDAEIPNNDVIVQIPSNRFNVDSFESAAKCEEFLKNIVRRIERGEQIGQSELQLKTY